MSEEDEKAIDGNAEKIGDALIQAAKSPGWSHRHSIAGLATAVGRMVWAGAVDHKEAAAALERFIGQLRIIVDRAFGTAKKTEIANTIFYLIDLRDEKEIGVYDGDGDEPPAIATAAAQKHLDETGHVCVLARGKLFFQKDK